MASLQEPTAPASERLADLLALRERLTKDLKRSKSKQANKDTTAAGAEEQPPLDYSSSLSLVLSIASSISSAAADSAATGGKHLKGPVPTTAAFEALELLLRRALTALSSPSHPEEPAVRSTFTPEQLVDLASTLYSTWDTHLPSAQLRLRACLALVLALAGPSPGIDVPAVKEELRSRALVDRWDSKRTLHTFDALLPYYAVEELADFAVGEGSGVEEGVTRRFTLAMVDNEEMAQLVGKVALAWVEKVWAAGEQEHRFWIRPALEACTAGGAKARHSVGTYVLQPVFQKRKEAFKAVLREGGFLCDGKDEAFEGKDEEELETALMVLKAGNAVNLVELDDAATSSASDSPKLALPLSLLLTCLTHSSGSLRTSALSLIVLAPSSSVPFPSASFALLRAFYAHSLGELDGEFCMSTTSLTGKLLLRLRDSAWKAARLSRKPGKAGAEQAGEYVERVCEWMQWFVDVLVRDNLLPARPYRLKINSLRMLDLVFQARVDPLYQLDDSFSAAAGGAEGEDAPAKKSATTGYSTYRKTATTQTPMFQAKHRKIDPSSASSSPSRPASPAPGAAPAAVAAVEPEAPWPFPLSLVNPLTTQVLLRQLLSTYTALRFLALSMLERFPSPLPGYDAGEAGRERVKRELLLPALRMIRSGREAEASAGAGVMGLLWRKWVLEGVQKGGEERWTLGEVGGWQEGVETKTGPAGFAFISSLLDLTEQQLSHYSANLAEAAHAAPMHGTLLALRHLFVSIPVSSYESLSTQEERRAIFHRALGVIRRVWEVTSPVLAAKAPEGTEAEKLQAEEGEADTEEARAIRFERKEKKAAADAAQAGEEEQDDFEVAEGSGGPQHKIILSACWRAMKEAGELLETILRLPSELGTASFQQVWSYNEIREIGDLFGVWLARIRHRGAFMAVHPCYTRAAAALLVAGKEWEEVRKLPEEWLDNHLDSIVSKRISFTRRSAGIPYLILGLLLTILSSSRSAFDRAFTRLFEIAESTTSELSDESRVHAMNTIRTVFLDAKGGVAAGQYIERGFLVSISLFFSPSWILRNVAMMLFASLTQRALNARRINLDRDATSLARRLSMEEFFGRYPALKGVLRDELERGWKESLEDSPSSNLHSSLFSILLLLSLLQTPKKIGSAASSGSSLAAPFIPLVKQCAKSRVWKIREVAGDALTGLIASNEVGDVAEKILTDIKGELDSLDQNELHGRLVQALSLLEGVDADSFEGDSLARVSSAYLSLAPLLLPTSPSSSAEPIRPRFPYATLAAFLLISLRLPSLLSSPTPASDFAASVLIHSQTWAQSAYHLPSAEEFLRSAWLVAYAEASAREQQEDRRRRRAALLLGALSDRSIEIKRAALEKLDSDELLSTADGADEALSAALLRVVLDDMEAGDVRVRAAELLRSSSSSTTTSFQGKYAELAVVYRETPCVPLREAVLPVLAAAVGTEDEREEVLRLVDEASGAEQPVESRESAGLALLALSRSLRPSSTASALPAEQKGAFALSALRMLQDDDITVREYAYEAAGLKLVEGKAVEEVLREGGEELLARVRAEEEKEFAADLSVLANPSSLLFAIEKPNIFLDPLLVLSLLVSSFTLDKTKAKENLQRLEEAVEASKRLEEGPLGRGGNEVVTRWEAVLGARVGKE
ncbi:hypothetical protein JCM8097_002413 [Rhodosporidiobolus ruineniae]